MSVFIKEIVILIWLNWAQLQSRSCAASWKGGTIGLTHHTRTKCQEFTAEAETWWTKSCGAIRLRDSWFFPPSSAAALFMSLVNLSCIFSLQYWKFATSQERLPSIREQLREIIAKEYFGTTDTLNTTESSNSTWKHKTRERYLFLLQKAS